MGKLGRVTMSALALVSACSASHGRSRDTGEHKPLERVAVEQLAQPVDERFDAQGALKPSGKRFVWLELPMGFEPLAGSTARSSSFEARDMPLVKVRDYLDARLAPEKLDFARNGVYFRRSRATHTQLALEPLEVALLEAEPGSRTVRLVIDDLSPSPEPPLSVGDAREQLARERGRIE